MRVLVTGSAGFVGKHTVTALEARGDEVILCDKVIGDDLSYSGVAERLLHRDPDIVVHLASSCSTPGSLMDPMGTYRDTVATAANIIEAARRKDVPVIVTSSVKARDGYTPYGAAKQMVETWALEYRHAYKLPIVINRPGTIYGPGQEGSPESGWIAWFLKAKEEKLRVTVNGSGKQVRDLLHVSDYVRLLLMQIDDIEKYNNGYIYDVGGGTRNAVSVLDIVEYLRLKHEFGPERYGDADIYVGHNDIPGWEPTIHWAGSETFG